MTVYNVVSVKFGAKYLGLRDSRLISHCFFNSTVRWDRTKDEKIFNLKKYRK
jgi:hypothetical protein